MAPSNTEPIPHSLEETTYHFLAPLTVPGGEKGPGAAAARAVAPAPNTGAAAAPFLRKPQASNPETGKGWGMGSEPQHGHDL